MPCRAVPCRRAGGCCCTAKLRTTPGSAVAEKIMAILYNKDDLGVEI